MSFFSLPSSQVFGLPELFLFTAAVIGMTCIIVDPATIFQPVRDFVGAKSGKVWEFINKVMSCYQCCGTWVGFLCSALVFPPNIFTIILGGMAGSFLATWGATYLNYLEARSVITLNDDDGL